MRAIVLVAGRGKRLRPVTDYVPKPLIPFFGRPFLEYTLKELHGLVEEVVLVVHYQADKIWQALGAEYKGVPLRYVFQESLAGSGDALLAAREFLRERALVILGDVFVERRLVEEMLEREGDHVVSVARVDDPVNHLGVAVKDGRVSGAFVESDWVDRGVWLFSPAFFDYVDGTPLQRGELRIMRTVERMADLGVAMDGCCSHLPWIQIGDHSGVDGVLETLQFFAERRGLGETGSVDGEVGRTEVVNSVVFGPGRVRAGSIEDSLVYMKGDQPQVTVKREICVLGAGDE